MVVIVTVTVVVVVVVVVVVAVPVVLVVPFVVAVVFVVDVQHFLAQISIFSLHLMLISPQPYVLNYLVFLNPFELHESPGKG